MGTTLPGGEERKMDWNLIIQGGLILGVGGLLVFVGQHSITAFGRLLKLLWIAAWARAVRWNWHKYAGFLVFGVIAGVVGKSGVEFLNQRGGGERIEVRAEKPIADESAKQPTNPGDNEDAQEKGRKKIGDDTENHSPSLSVESHGLEPPALPGGHIWKVEEAKPHNGKSGGKEMLSLAPGLFYCLGCKHVYTNEKGKWWMWTAETFDPAPDPPN